MLTAFTFVSFNRLQRKHDAPTKAKKT